MKLDAGDLAEIKELSSGTHADCRYFAKLFHVRDTTIAYHIDYKGHHDYVRRKSAEWKQKNPEKWKAMVKKAVAKYQHTEKGKQKIRKYYLKHKKNWPFYNPEKYMEYLMYQKFYYYFIKKK